MSTIARARHPKFPNAKDVEHLRGCPASADQPTFPMPPDIEVYRLDPQRLADGEGDPGKRPAVTVSHCCKCGGLGYSAPEGR